MNKILTIIFVMMTLPSITHSSDEQSRENPLAPTNSQDRSTHQTPEPRFVSSNTGIQPSIRDVAEWFDGTRPLNQVYPHQSQQGTQEPSPQSSPSPQPVPIFPVNTGFLHSQSRDMHETFPSSSSYLPSLTLSSSGGELRNPTLTSTDDRTRQERTINHILGVLSPDSLTRQASIDQDRQQPRFSQSTDPFVSSTTARGSTRGYPHIQRTPLVVPSAEQYQQPTQSSIPGRPGNLSSIPLPPQYPTIQNFPEYNPLPRPSNEELLRQIIANQRRQETLINNFMIRQQLQETLINNLTMLIIFMASQMQAIHQHLHDIMTRGQYQETLINNLTMLIIFMASQMQAMQRQSTGDITITSDSPMSSVRISIQQSPQLRHPSRIIRQSARTSEEDLLPLLLLGSLIGNQGSGNEELGALFGQSGGETHSQPTQHNATTQMQTPPNPGFFFFPGERRQQ